MKKLITILVDNEFDTGSAFDEFPKDALYAVDLVEDKDTPNLEKMESLGAHAGRAIGRGVDRAYK